MTPAARSRERSWDLLILLAVLLVFGAALGAPFIYDDEGYLLRNPLVAGPWPGLRAFFLSSFAGQGEYGPLNTLGHWLLYRAAGPEPWLYRLTSLLLHGLNACLLRRVYRRLLGSELAAGLAALLFALYPAHAEVLALSSFKKHLGAAFFGLVLLQVEAWPRARPWRAPAAWALLSLGLLCKESALLLPVLPLLLAVAGGAPWRRALREDALLYGGLFAVCAAYAAARVVVVPRSWAPLAGGAWPAHLLTCGKILLWYLSRLPWPFGLCFEHSLSPVPWPSPEAFLVLGGLAAAGFGVAALWDLDRLAGAGLAWALLAFLPFSNLLPYLNMSLVADRYFYLPSAGFLLAAARLTQRLPIPGRRAGWLAAGAAAAFAAAGFLHIRRFNDPWTLWRAAAACAPGNPRVHVSLAYMSMKRLDFAGAAASFERALALDPALTPLFVLDLAASQAELGRLNEAEALLEAEAARSGRPEVWNNLGALRLRAGRPNRAREPLETAARLEPGAPDVRLNLGSCYLALGRLVEARTALETAAREPGLEAKALGLLAEVELRQGRPARAEALYRESLKLEPLQWESVKGLSSLLARRGDKPGARALVESFLARLDAIEGGLTDEGGLGLVAGLRARALEQEKKLR